MRSIKRSGGRNFKEMKWDLFQGLEIIYDFYFWLEDKEDATGISL